MKSVKKQEIKEYHKRNYNKGIVCWVAEIVENKCCVEFWRGEKKMKRTEGKVTRRGKCLWEAGVGWRADRSKKKVKVNIMRMTFFFFEKSLFPFCLTLVFFLFQLLFYFIFFLSS